MATLRHESEKNGITHKAYHELVKGDTFTPCVSSIKKEAVSRIVAGKQKNWTNNELQCSQINDEVGTETTKLYLRITPGQAKNVEKHGDVDGKQFEAYEYKYKKVINGQEVEDIGIGVSPKKGQKSVPTQPVAQAPKPAPAPFKKPSFNNPAARVELNGKLSEFVAYIRAERKDFESHLGNSVAFKKLVSTFIADGQLPDDTTQAQIDEMFKQVTQ